MNFLDNISLYQLRPDTSDYLRPRPLSAMFATIKEQHKNNLDCHLAFT